MYRDKIIFVGIILFLSINACNASTQTIYMNEWETKCIGGLYIDMYSINSTACLISIDERAYGQAPDSIECDFSPHNFIFIQQKNVGYYIFINNSGSGANPKFIGRNFDMSLTITNIFNGVVTMEIYISDEPAPTPTPTPDPTPDPTPTATPDPDPTPDATPDPDDSNISGFDPSSMGGHGGTSELYEDIGAGLAEGDSSGSGAAFGGMFYLLIPFLFMLCVLKMLQKVL